MLVGNANEMPPALRALAEASAKMYPEFVHGLEDESGLKVDLREQGTILLSAQDNFPDKAERISPELLEKMEPELKPAGTVPEARGRPSPHEHGLQAAFLSERSLDP